MKFRNYYKLQQDYKHIFDRIFESYYNKGYFGDVNKEEVKDVQYKWFKRVVTIIEYKDEQKLIPFITNHNNKLTREFYSEISGNNIKNKGKEYILNKVQKGTNTDERF